MRITLLMVAGFLVIAGTGFFLLMRTISEDIERQYSQASEEPLVDFAHLFASLLEQDVRDGKIDIGLFREGFDSAYRRQFLAKIYQIEMLPISQVLNLTDDFFNICIVFSVIKSDSSHVIH